MGRNIWQSDWPVAMIKAVRAIVHDDVNAEKAYDLFLKEKEKDKSGQQLELPKKIKTIARTVD
jgi:putative autoinducer-2 (AI-2) aldolase